MATMYVVFALTKGEREPDFKVFLLRGDASSYAAKQVKEGADTADVFEINDAIDARAAKAALQMGEGRFLEPHGRRATQEEIKSWVIMSVL
jgi:hypothetical protein